jgi:hypothetical protein
MSIEQAVFTNEQKLELSNYINAYRANHNSPPLEWDDTISQFAQEYSLYLVSNNLFQHSNKEGYGENLAYFQGYPNEMMSLIKKSIDLWYDEIKLYNFNYPGYSPGTGHFTCLVWKSSTKFGMGYSYNNNTKIVDITMNTSPPGNIIGQFQDNVYPPKSTMPVPAPAPAPAPVPAPEPEPEPEPVPDYAEQVTKIVNLLYILINMIRSNGSVRSLVYSLDIIIALIYELDDNIIKDKAYLINRLYYVRYSIKTNRSPRFMYVALYEVIRSLQNSIQYM